MSFKRINISQAKDLLKNPKSILLDIRDTESYNYGHVDIAINLTQESLSAFLDSADKSSPVLVMCYHGNSSQSVAQYLSVQGFDEVYSIDGGYEAWV
ncbi:MAG: thiosulfate sulfurtransferase GlpE [Dysgonomonas sp.]|nr:thiosulfate sulfurtransferase GlpE [Dysgonomonas sp.]